METALLRKRLEPSNEKYIFSHILKEKNIPSDGLLQYFKQIWYEILNDKDLNIVNYFLIFFKLFSLRKKKCLPIIVVMK